MRITIESDERTTTLQTETPASAPATTAVPAQEPALDAGPSRAVGSAEAVGAEAAFEAVAAGPPPPELVEAIAAAEAVTQPGAATSDALEGGPAPTAE